MRRVEGRTEVRLILGVVAATALAGCAEKGEIVDAAGGIAAVRSACPVVGVPAGTGDITLFSPADRRDADAIDVTATLTNVRSTCGDQGDDVQTNLTFDVLARRAQPAEARDVVLPYYVAIVRAGNSVVAKRIGQVPIHFAAGQVRAQAQGAATTLVTRSAATLPDDIKKRITERRKPGEEDAAIDPLSRPEVRAAVLRTSFEALVGFQLTDDQLKYNATR
jgi:hypothetical protein